MHLQRQVEKISKFWHIEREHKITPALNTINSTFGKGSLKLVDQGSGQIKTSSGN
jgi:hypothetical protein